MKLDRVFYENTRSELLKAENTYNKKYLPVVILVGMICLGMVFFDLWPLIPYLLLLLLGLFASGNRIFAGKAEEKILRKIAEDNGGTYRKKVSLEGEKAAMFRQKEHRRATNEVSFQDESGARMRFFHYRFEVGAGRTTREYSYRVFGVSGLGDIPHMYLNYRPNQYGMSLGQKLSLPSEFEREFTLSIPAGYHLEALQVFTPDILHEILNLPIKCDIEFVDGEVLIFLEGKRTVSKDFSVFEANIEGAKKIVGLLKPKFKNLRWSKVGDKTTYL